jgi:hypothetical protein
MHRAEYNAVLDRSEQLLVRFEEGFESVEVGRRDPQGGGIGAVTPSARAMTAEAVSLIDGFPSRHVRRKVLRGRGGWERYNGRNEGEGT